MATSGRQKYAEFQAVLLAGGTGSKLYPLTEDTPKPLLSVANRPLISFQLEYLERAGFAEVIIVTISSYAAKISDYITERAGPIRVDLVVFDDHIGTADALRRIKDKLWTDFVVLPSDLVTEGSLHELADVHRIRDSTVTMMMKKEVEVKDSRGKLKRREATDFVGLANEDRVVYFASSLALDEGVSLSKAVLRRRARVTIHSQLSDAHLYMFSHWVLRLLEAQPRLSSIKHDLIPYLVRCQFRGRSALPAEVAEEAASQFAMAHALSSTASESEAAAAGADSGEADLVRCYAHLLAPTGAFCRRANTSAAFAQMNATLPRYPVSSHTPWAPIRGVRTKFKLCLVAEGCQFAEKVSVKSSVVGAGCTIGAGSKLMNVTLMQGVVVGAHCIIQNSILCAGAVVGDKCNLNECLVAAAASVPAGSRLKGEALEKEADEDEFKSLG